jgi:hypothetical protein
MAVILGARECECDYRNLYARPLDAGAEKLCVQIRRRTHTTRRARGSSREPRVCPLICRRKVFKPRQTASLSPGSPLDFMRRARTCSIQRRRKIAKQPAREREISLYWKGTFFYNRAANPLSRMGKHPPSLVYARRRTSPALRILIRRSFAKTSGCITSKQQLREAIGLK